GKQRGPVAFARVEKVKRVAVGIDIDEPGGIDVADRHLSERHPRATRLALENFSRAVGSEARRQTQLKIAVREQVGIFGVFELQYARAGHDVDPEQIEAALLTRIVPDQHLL